MFIDKLYYIGYGVVEKYKNPLFVETKNDKKVEKPTTCSNYNLEYFFNENLKYLDEIRKDKMKFLKNKNQIDGL